MATNQVVGEGLCFHPSLSGDRSSRSMLPTCRGKRWRKTRWRHQPALVSVNFGIDPLPGTQAVPWRDRGNEKNVGAWRVLRSWFMVMSSCKTIDFGQGENEKMEQTIQQTAAALDGLNQFVLIAGKQLGRTDLFLKHFGSQNLSLKGIAQISLGMPIDQPFQMSLTPQELTNGNQDRQLVRMRMDYMDGLSSGQTMDDWDKRFNFCPQTGLLLRLTCFDRLSHSQPLILPVSYLYIRDDQDAKTSLTGFKDEAGCRFYAHLSCLWMVLKPAKWTNLGFGFSELGCCSVLCSLLTQRFAVSLAKFESGWSDEEPAERMHLREDQDAERTWGRSGQQTGDVDSVGWNSRMTVTMTELLFNDRIWNQSIHVNWTPPEKRIGTTYLCLQAGVHFETISWWTPASNQCLFRRWAQSG